MNRAGQNLESLRAARSRFGRGWPRRKLELLAHCADLQLTNPRILRDYHELLLFVVAYPDDHRILSVAEAELQRVARAAHSLAATERSAEALRDSGIFGTAIESAFSIDMVAWLVRRFPHDVEVAWEDGSAGRGLDDFLANCVSHVECDGLIGNCLSKQEWVRLAKGAGDSSDLAWLLRQLQRLPYSAEALDQVFDGLDVRVHWSLMNPGAATTFLRFPRRPVFYQSRAMRRRFSSRKLVARRLPPRRPLSSKEVDRLLDVARASLVVRRRETDPVTYANPREITLFSLEQGVDLVLFGMLPGRRLPIESFFGYVLAHNRVPVAYGGGWIFFDRAEIGINVFDTYRGAESSYLFGQVLRVYYHHFGARRFVVDSFQIGADNEEAIRSGAFWFYYRLGFRPIDPELRRLARDECAAIRSDRSYRTPRSMLRRLGSDKLVMGIGRSGGEDVPDLTAIGLAVTATIGARFRGDRLLAEQWARRRITRCLGIRGTGRWPKSQRQAFERLSLLMAMIPDLGNWSAKEKRALVSLMRAKGGVRELEFAEQLQRHARLRSALTTLARSMQDA